MEGCLMVEWRSAAVPFVIVVGYVARRMRMQVCAQ